MDTQTPPYSAKNPLLTNHPQTHSTLTITRRPPSSLAHMGSTWMVCLQRNSPPVSITAGWL